MTVDLPCHLQPTSQRNNRQSLSLYSGGMRHLNSLVKTGKTSLKPFVPNFSKVDLQLWKNKTWLKPPLRCQMMGDPSEKLLAHITKHLSYYFTFLPGQLFSYRANIIPTSTKLSNFNGAVQKLLHRLCLHMALTWYTFCWPRGSL